jgi:hypothetical protein
MMLWQRKMRRRHQTSMPAPSIAPVESTPPPHSVRREALWLWGRLREFVSEGLLDKAPEEILAALTPPIREEIRALAPKVATWLGQIGGLS